MPLTPCITPPLPTSDFSHSCIDRPFCASLVLLAFRAHTSSDSPVSFCFLPHVIPLQPRMWGCQCLWEQFTAKGAKPVDKPLAAHPSGRNSRRCPFPLGGSQRNKFPPGHSGGPIHPPLIWSLLLP